MTKIFKTWILAAFAAGLVSPCLAPASIDSSMQRCRNLPGNPRTTDPAHSSVNGKLLTGIPLGAVCHDPYYDETQCNYVRENWAVPSFYKDNMIIQMSCGAQNLTCDPWSDRSLPSELGNMAPYAVNVTCPADVAARLAFARQHNIRVSSKNTGHEYNGKPVATGSLVMD